MNLLSREQKANKIILIGFIENILLTLFKLYAGIYGRSNAIIADAIHSLSDLSTDIVVFVGLKFSSKPIDKSHSYGHGKIETLSAVIIAIVLIYVGFKIFLNGWISVYVILMGQNIETPGWIAFYAAVVSIIAKEILFRYTFKVAKEINSSSLMANAWHHRSDAFSSIGVTIGIFGAILLGEKFRILDPIAAIIVSLIILQQGVVILFTNTNELLDASLSTSDQKSILDIITGIAAVSNPHKLRTRRIGNNISIDVHIEVDQDLTVKQGHDIATQVEDSLRAKYGKESFVSVHVEPRHYDSKD